MTTFALIIVSILALSLAAFAWAIHKAEDAPGEWPELDKWEADKPARDAAWDQHVNEAIATTEAKVVPFRTDTKDRIAGIIAANRTKHLNWDDAFGGDR